MSGISPNAYANPITCSSLMCGYACDTSVRNWPIVYPGITSVLSSIILPLV